MSRKLICGAGGTGSTLASGGGGAATAGASGAVEALNVIAEAL